MRSSTPPLAANASFFMSTGGVGALSEALHTQPTPWPRDNFAGALAKGQTPYLLLIVPAATVEGVEGVASGWAGQEHTPADEHAWVEIGCTISTVRRVNTLELALTA